MSNTSATGGYLAPTGTNPYPGSITFLQFMNTVMVGISGLPGNLVRPKWQIDPPVQPDVCTDWLAFGVENIKAPGFIYSGQDDESNNITQRQEELEVQCHFYGPNAESICSQTRDGFQVPQNLEALNLAQMGFISTGDMNHVPDLINERWFDRFIMSVFLRRQVNRTYPILTFLSSAGQIKTQIGSPYTNKVIPISVTEPEE